MALLAVPILFWNAWTIVAWVASGPELVIPGSDGSANWYVARILEGLIVLVSVPTAVYVVRGCLRARRLLTFDVMMVLAGLTVSWADFGVNVIQPIWLTSSNFVHLSSNACGHMPLVVNAECGRPTDPFLFLWLVYGFGVLALAIAAERGFRRVRQRWPRISTARIIAIVVIFGLAVELSLELVLIRLGLWTYVAPISMHLGGSFRYPLAEVIEGTLFFAFILMMRISRDDKGRTFLERGMDQYSPRRRGGVTLLAVYTFFQFVAWIPATVPLILAGAYQTDPWPKLPAYLEHGVCDSPGVKGTAYGPCPGDPGFRLPGRWAGDDGRE